MRLFIWAALAASVLLGPASGSVAAQDASEIKAAQARWEQAFARGDGATAAEEMYTEDARLLPPGEPIVEGRDAIGKYWQGGFDAGFRDLKLGLIAVDMVGDDTMIETGTWAVTAPGDAGARVAVDGKALVVWKKGSDGVWRMAQDMWSTNK